MLSSKISIELIGILRGDFLQVVGHLVGAADNEVIARRTSETSYSVDSHFGWSSSVPPSLDGLAGDAACFDQLVDTGLRGVEEGLVAQVAVDDVDNILDVRCFLGFRLRGAGRQTENHDRCKQQCDDFFHVFSSIMFNLYDCGDKIPSVIVQD